MSVGSNVVKITAKTALKGNFLRVSIACLIFVFGCIITSGIAELVGVVMGEAAAFVISLLIMLFLNLPIGLGVIRYIWRMLFSVTDNPISVFYWFSEKRLYIKAFKFILQFLLRMAVAALVFNIPSLILFALSKSVVFDIIGISTPVWAANLGYYSILLRNLSFVAVFFAMLKFYMAPWLFVADENIDIGEAMYNSSVISRKSSIDFIGLIFTSIGWIILSFLVLPLPFTLPLILTYYGVHIRFAVAEYNRHINGNEFHEAGFI